MLFNEIKYSLDILEYLIFSKNIFSQILQFKILEKCIFVENFIILENLIYF